MNVRQASSTFSSGNDWRYFVIMASASTRKHIWGSPHIGAEGGMRRRHQSSQVVWHDQVGSIAKFSPALPNRRCCGVGPTFAHDIAGSFRTSGCCFCGSRRVMAADAFGGGSLFDEQRLSLPLSDCRAAISLRLGELASAACQSASASARRGAHAPISCCRGAAPAAAARAVSGCFLVGCFMGTFSSRRIEAVIGSWQELDQFERHQWMWEMFLFTKRTSIAMAVCLVR